MSNKSLSVLGKRSYGLCFVLSAPAGTGKTTLAQMLIKEFSELKTSISYTTRPPRSNEKHGQDYYFISESEFEAKIASSDFLEYVKLHGYYYGTSLQTVLDQQGQGKHIILVIDTQGALQLKKKLSSVLIFIQPPSDEVLRERLMKRQTETPLMLEKRLNWAKFEMEAMTDYDYLIINDDLQLAYEVLRSIIIAETHRIEKCL